MAHVISTIGLKGGMGKTTTIVGLAEVLSVDFGKKVLVVDLDPYARATTLLIGEDRWAPLDAAGRTLVTLFTDSLRGDGEPPRFDLEATLQRRASRVDEVRRVDLLPSSLPTPSGRLYPDNPTDLLRRAVRPILDDYDFVLIDCPPDLGIVTLNGLRISDGYIIPMTPDLPATRGIPRIQAGVRALADSFGGTIHELGIVITRYRAASPTHVNTCASCVAIQICPESSTP